MFGSVAVTYGKVYKQRNGNLRVKITSSKSQFGEAPGTGTRKLTNMWTVDGDPEIARRQKKREQESADREKAQEKEITDIHKKIATSRAAALKAGDKVFKREEIRIGDILHEHFKGKTYKVDGLETNNGKYDTINALEVGIQPEYEEDEDGNKYRINGIAIQVHDPRSNEFNGELYTVAKKGAK
jgi:hypothetical protein